MNKNVVPVLKLLRIKDWVKNFFVFIPLIFSKHLFHFQPTFKAILGFFFFSFVSSIVYIFNDIKDVEQDKKHPKKKNRPLPSGAISIKQAQVLLLMIIILLTLLSYFLNFDSLLVAILYILINIFYSLYLKHVVIIDVFCIAAGFVLRIIYGAVVINVPVSSWLLLTTMFLSLFLALVKRYAEMVNLGDNTTYARKVLNEYSISYLLQLITMTSAATILSYALYTVSERTIQTFNTENLIFTTPFIVFGLFRYLYLVNKKISGESPSDALYKDFTMVINILIYIIVVITLIY